MQSQPLSPAFNAAVMTIANRLFPCGYDISPDAPSSLEALNAHIAKTGRIAVSSENSERTIYADAEHNYAFRAWHDWCHWKLQSPFDGDTADYPGERSVLALQQEHIRKLYGHGAIAERFCKILEAEIVGQIEYAKIHNEFPGDQHAFTDGYLLGKTGAYPDWPQGHNSEEFHLGWSLGAYGP